MQLEKKNIHMNQKKCQSNVQVTLDNDMIVPDVQPDIVELIREQGEVVLQEVKPMSGKVMVKGVVRFTLLYLGEDPEVPVHTLQGQLPFEEVINMDQTCSEDGIQVRWNLENLSSSLINSRKVSVMALLSLICTAEQIYDEETVTGLDSEEEIPYQTTHIELTQLKLSKKDVFRIKDEIRLPSGKPNIAEPLLEEVTLQAVETRLLENQLNLKGELSIFLLYQSIDGTLQYYDTEVPFSGMIDCNGCSEAMIPDIRVALGSRDIQVKADEDGEERLIDFEVVIDLNMKVYEEEEVDVLSDLYSLSQEITPVVKETMFERLLQKNSSRSRVNGKLHLEEGQPGIVQVCHASGNVVIDDEYVEADGVRVEGVIEVNVLYLTDNEQMPLASVKGTIPYIQLVEAKELTKDSTYEIVPDLSQLTVLQVDTDEMEVKALITLELVAFAYTHIAMITDYTVENLNLVKLQELPGITGYIVKDGDTLWSIAKNHYTTIENIMEVNHLEQEQLTAGQRLLILKEVNLA